MICAGYEKEMDDFFQSNPGFKLLGCFQMVLTAKMSKVGNDLSFKECWMSSL